MRHYARHLCYLSRVMKWPVVHSLLPGSPGYAYSSYVHSHRRPIVSSQRLPPKGNLTRSWDEIIIHWGVAVSRTFVRLFNISHPTFQLFIYYHYLFFYLRHQYTWIINYSKEQFIMFLLLYLFLRVYNFYYYIRIGI